MQTPESLTSLFREAMIFACVIVVDSADQAFEYRATWAFASSSVWCGHLTQDLPLNSSVGSIPRERASSQMIPARFHRPLSGVRCQFIAFGIPLRRRVLSMSRQVRLGRYTSPENARFKRRNSRVPPSVLLSTLPTSMCRRCCCTSRRTRCNPATYGCLCKLHFFSGLATSRDFGGDLVRPLHSTRSIRTCGNRGGTGPETIGFGASTGWVGSPAGMLWCQGIPSMIRWCANANLSNKPWLGATSAPLRCWDRVPAAVKDAPV